MKSVRDCFRTVAYTTEQYKQVGMVGANDTTRCQRLVSLIDCRCKGYTQVRVKEMHLHLKELAL